MLDTLFSPDSVAVVGASRQPGKVGHDILNNLIQHGYAGKIYPVNPKGDEILGLTCYPRLTEIDGPVEHVIIVIPPRFVLSAIDDCIAKGVQAATVITAGFRESGGDGAEMERQLGEKCKGAGLRVLGPNCLGLINTGASFNGTFAHGMPRTGSISFFSQSGALCTAILDWSFDRQVGFSKFVSLGNKMDITEVDLLRYLADDPDTDVILGYIEGVGDGRAFIDAATDASRKKPVIITKSGGTAAGARAASSHTGTLAGSESAFNAAFIQSGVIRAHTMQDLFDYALAFARQGVPSGPGVAVITNAGGPGIITADAIERSGLQIANLTKETTEALRASLPPTAAVYNPVDVIGDAGTDRYQSSLAHVLADPNVHSAIVLLTPQASTDSAGTAQVVADAANASDKTILTSWMGGPMVAEGVKVLTDHSVPNYPFPERAVSALDAMASYRAWRERPAAQTRRMKFDKDLLEAIVIGAKATRYHDLGERACRTILEACGFRIPQGMIATSGDEAAQAAERFGYPVVLKIASRDILHKSDVGGVRVGLANADEVHAGFDEIMTSVHRHMPQADVWGVSVQEMVRGGKEVILGMFRDMQFGPLIMFGLGGIYVEVLKDVSFRTAPLTVDDANEMIREIRAFPLLRGVRGEKPSDIDAIVDGLLRLSQLVTMFPDILEMDINPLVVFEQGQGAVAIDARLSLAEDTAARH